MDLSRFQQNVPLAPYTTVKIGGPAQYFANPKTSSEFVQLLKEIGQQTPLIKITLLGNGSNVLISDQGIEGIVIKNSANSVEFLSNHQIKVDSGVQLPTLLQQCAAHQLAGLEEYAYIPSSIGGAIFGNIHGVNKNDFNKFLVSIEIFDLNFSEIRNLKSEELNWSYDTSEFQQHPEWIIISAILQLSPGESETSKKIIEEIIAKKVATQSMNSLGSVFKNLPAVAGRPGDSAGRIIDQELNLKGFQIGDAQISPKHGNFIVNLGHATASDYLQVINKVKSAAFAKGFVLEPEIKFLGKF